MKYKNYIEEAIKKGQIPSTPLWDHTLVSHDDIRKWLAEITRNDGKRGRIKKHIRKQLNEKED